MAICMPSFLATDAQAYEHFMARWSQRLAGPFLDLAGVKPSDRVLDVRCGTGVIAASLAEWGCTVARPQRVSGCPARRAAVVRRHRPCGAGRCTARRLTTDLLRHKQASWCPVLHLRKRTMSSRAKGSSPSTSDR